MPNKRRFLKKFNPHNWLRKTSNCSSNDGDENVFDKHQSLVEERTSITEKETFRAQSITSTEFLRKTTVCRDMAFFDNSEICTGRLLGTGRFCEVFEIRQISPQSGLERSCRMTESFSMLKKTELQSNEKRRLELAKTCKTSRGKCRYALKKLSSNIPWFLSDDVDAAAAAFVVEARLLSRLDHPNIIKIHGWTLEGDDNFHGGFFLVLDRLSETMSQRIDAWKQQGADHRVASHENLIRKTEYALGIALALEYLHERRLIYRDLKPQNIGFIHAVDNTLHSSDDDIKERIQLFDFEFCRELPTSPTRCDITGENLYRMSRVGSPAYIAPELLLKDKIYNCKADVYSLAALFYEMLCPKKSMGFVPKFMPSKTLATRGARRDVIKAGLPVCIQDFLESSWKQSIYERISMKEASLRLDGLLSELKILSPLLASPRLCKDSHDRD